MGLGLQAFDEWARGQDAVDTAFRRIELLTAVGAALSASEMLATAKAFDDNGLLSWPVCRTRIPALHNGHGRYVDALLRYPQVVGVFQTRLLSALGLLAPGVSRRTRAACLAGLTGTAAALHVRHNFGSDGADHFTFINSATALLEKLFPHDPKAREVALAFIAAQSCLSYFTSGAVKLTSPIWRSGDAITGIFRTRTYGDKYFYRLFRNRPALAKALAWMVMLAEVGYPLVMVAPKPIARLILLNGVAFHLGNARFMGLNRFLWSFVASYPAVAHFARGLGGGARRSPVRGARTGRGNGWDRVPRALRYSAVAAGAVTGAALAIRSMRANRPTTPPPAPGRLVKLGADSIHLLSNPAGDGPTVLFESALACPCTEWGWVTKAIDGRLRYLAYDRPGNGWSSQFHPPESAKDLNALTMSLLEELGLPGPYLLVAHSVGGLLARTFAHHYPDQVAGLVLVDSTHPDQLTRSQLQQETFPLVGQSIGRAYWKARLGLVSPTDDYFGRIRDFGAVSKLPPDVAEATQQVICFPEPWRGARRECVLWHTHWAAETRAATLPPDLPVGVLTAGEQAAGDPAHPRLQGELAGLSQVSRHEIVTGSNHETLVMTPEFATKVVDMVEWAVGAHRSRLAHQPS